MEENIVTIDVSKLLGNAPSQDSQTVKNIELAASNCEDALLAILQKNTKPNRLKRLKTKTRILLRAIDRWRYSVKQYFLDSDYPSSICFPNVPHNPCSSCGIEKQKNIMQLFLLGYLVIEEEVSRETKNCCVLTQELKKLITQEQRRKQKRYALKFRLANLL